MILNNLAKPNNLSVKVLGTRALAVVGTFSNIKNVDAHRCQHWTNVLQTDFFQKKFPPWWVQLWDQLPERDPGHAAQHAPDLPHQHAADRRQDADPLAAAGAGPRARGPHRRGRRRHPGHSGGAEEDAQPEAGERQGAHNHARQLKVWNCPLRPQPRHPRCVFVETPSKY